MRVGRVAVSSALLLGALAAVVAAPPAAQEEPKQAEKPAQAEPAKPLEIPEEEKARKTPVPTSPESAEAGRRLYRSQCAFCHGEKGDGRGEFAQELKLAVPDFTQAEQQKKRTDGDLFYIITEGHDRMPGQKARLRPEQKWHLINFIRSLAPPEKTPKK